MKCCDYRELSYNEIADIIKCNNVGFLFCKGNDFKVRAVTYTNTYSCTGYTFTLYPCPGMDIATGSKVCLQIWDTACKKLAMVTGYIHADCCACGPLNGYNDTDALRCTWEISACSVSGIALPCKD